MARRDKAGRQSKRVYQIGSGRQITRVTTGGRSQRVERTSGGLRVSGRNVRRGEAAGVLRNARRTGYPVERVG